MTMRSSAHALPYCLAAEIVRVSYTFADTLPHTTLCYFHVLHIIHAFPNVTIICSIYVSYQAITIYLQITVSTTHAKVTVPIVRPSPELQSQPFISGYPC